MTHRTTYLLLLSMAVLLTACASRELSHETLMQNPLYAERYAEEMVQMLADLEIDEDPIITDEAKRVQMVQERNTWLETARKAREEQAKGITGFFIEMSEFVTGEALVLGNTLYLGPTFEATPGMNLHLYLTTEVDPRNGPFPDPTSIDVGTLRTPYGQQHYDLPDISAPQAYRTAVLWDVDLGRLHGFAQLAQ